MAILAAIGRGGAVVALILLMVALLKQLIMMVGFLLALVKFVVILGFVGLIVMVAVAIYRDYSRRKSESART